MNLFLKNKVSLIVGVNNNIMEEIVKLFVGAFVMVVEVQDNLRHQVVQSIIVTHDNDKKKT